jgi:peptidoglycan/LPS O-acetylase OafA/YrhL
MQLGAHRDNNFDAVRLIAALAVVVGHAWPLTGLSHPPRLGGIPVFTLAVFVFFSLSGYLVATSWRRDPRVLPFLARRASRIFPALIVVIVLTTFLIGPIATRLALNDYFSSSQTWTYLTNVSLVASYDLPGVFDANPRPVVNGALWTLGPEFLCYLGVMTLGLLAIALRIRRAPARAAMFVAIGVVMAIASRLPFTAFDGPRAALTAMVFFACGAALAQLPQLRLPLWPCALIAPVWLVVGSLLPESSQILVWVSLPYLVLALGARSTPYIRRAGRFGDVSYGVYLWGFPIQQLIWQAWPQLNLGVNLVLVLAFTLATAFASWHLVEKRTLSAVRSHLRTTARARPIGTTVEVRNQIDFAKPE